MRKHSVKLVALLDICFYFLCRPVGFAAAINTISNNTPTINVSEEERQRILDEENARLQQLKVDNSSQLFIPSQLLVVLLEARILECALFVM